MHCVGSGNRHAIQIDVGWIVIVVLRKLDTISHVGIYPDYEKPDCSHFIMSDDDSIATWYFRLSDRLHNWLEERGIPYELRQNGRHVYGPQADLLVPLEHAVLTKLTWGGK